MTQTAKDRSILPLVSKQMRNELKNFEWHVYGLSNSDLDYTIELIREIIADRKVQLKNKIANIEVFDAEGNKLDNLSGVADDAISDICHYDYIYNLYLWTFGLWRLQGIFEGIMKQEFFRDKNFAGLKSKLDFILKQGFVINSEDYSELLQWAGLRNALSHYPPEQNRPIDLDDTDLEEYIALVKRVIDDLVKQKKENNIA